MPEPMENKPVATLDVRQTKCPLNFVQTRLALEKIAVGQVLEVWVDPASQSVMNIPSSLRVEGQAVVYEELDEAMPGGHALKLGVRRLK